MTLLDDRPAALPDDATPAAPTRSWAPTASWRLAARLARREVRRRPGRTLLVALLVAVPVLAMTIGSIVVRSDTLESRFERNYGQADLATTQWSYPAEDGAPAVPTDLSAIGADIVPEGTTSTQMLIVYTSITPQVGEPVNVGAMRLDPTSPIVDGIIDVSAGSLPDLGSDGVLLDPDLAADLGVDVGDTLTLDRPDRTVRVMGLGEAANDHGRNLMVFGLLEPTELRGYALTTLVDLPDGTDGTRMIDTALRSGRIDNQTLGSASIELRDSGWYGVGGYATNATQALAWGWVAGALSLAALGVIIAAAFATSARRQLATVGQLAANGASPRLIRRTLSLQGTWSGAVGAAVGVGIGVAMFLLGRPVIETIVNRSWTNTVIRPLDLVVLFLTGTFAATLAALLPARSLANTSVLSALAGRRPIRPVQARTVAAGLVCFGAGLFLLAVATAGGKGSDGNNIDLFALVAVLGGVGVLAGMCLASPLAVTAATAIASRLSASWRLSGRSLARTRWRSAAVVTAIGVAGAFSVAAGSVSGNLDASPEGPTELPFDVAVITTQDGGDASGIDAATLREMRSVLDPSAESLVLGLRLDPPTDAMMQAAYNTSQTMVVQPSEVTIADDAFLDGVGLSTADRARLDDVGAMLLGYGMVVFDGPSTVATTSSPIRLIGVETDIEFDAIPNRDDFESRNAARSVIITEATAAELGLGVIPVGFRFTAAADLTSEQRRDLDTIRFGGDTSVDSWIVGDESPTYPTTVAGAWIDYQWVNYPASETLVQAAIVAATLLLVLLVVAIGLSLAAVESRDERNTLIAVGASPSTLRRRSATTATLLAVTGGVLAVPAGLLPVWVVSNINNEPVNVPLISITAVVVVVPTLVGAIALVVSGITGRFRPPKVMQAFTD